MTIISYSEVSKFQTCPRQYYYRFMLGYAPVEESQPITIGTKGHKLLQNFHEYLTQGHTKAVAHRMTADSARHIINKEGFADFSILPAWTLVDNYIRDTDFTAEAILIENRFLFPASGLTDDPFFEDIQIGFTPDVVFQRKSGRQDVEDYKFVARAWSKSKINRYQQSKLYQLLLNRMGYNVNRSIIRFFNVTTGKIVDQPYTLKKEEEQNLIDDFLTGIQDVIIFKEQINHKTRIPNRVMNYTTCGYCPFEFPCTLEAEGKNAQKTFDAQFVKSKYDYNR